MKKHTETPWHGSKTFTMDSMSFNYLLDENREQVVQVRGKDKKTVSADAEFIVKACNSHDALVEAVEVTTKVLCEMCEMHVESCGKKCDTIRLNEHVLKQVK